MLKKQIPTDQLRLGMYVVELDRPWLGTKFAFQGFPVTTEEELESLRTQCKSVYVDPERERWIPELPRRGEPLRGRVVYSTTTPVEKELPAAKQIYASCRRSVDKLFTTLKLERRLDVPALTTAVSSVTESISRNPDAMLLVNRVRERGDRQLGRAMDTAILMITFGRFLQYPRERLEVLGLAGVLLDVGRLEAGGAAGSKPLDAIETDPDVIAHVMASVDSIRATPNLPRGIADIVVQHHERQDAKGYPAGLEAHEISLDGAIAALVDAFCELTWDGAEGGHVSASNALSLLHKLRGTLFHEALVEQFIQCIGIYPVGSAVELSSGEIGIVIAQNLVRAPPAARDGGDRRERRADLSAPRARPREGAPHLCGRALPHPPHAAEGRAAGGSEGFLHLKRRRFAYDGSADARVTYRIALPKSEEGYGVSVPGFPGCWSQGATGQEALDNVREAIREYLSVVDEQLRGEDVREVAVIR